MNKIKIQYIANRSKKLSDFKMDQEVREHLLNFVKENLSIEKNKNCAFYCTTLENDEFYIDYKSDAYTKNISFLTIRQFLAMLEFAIMEVYQEEVVCIFYNNDCIFLNVLKKSKKKHET